MKILIAIILVAASVLSMSSFAAEWERLTVTSTNGTKAVTLDDKYTPPVELDGFFFPFGSVTNTVGVKLTLADGTQGTEFYSKISTNESLYVIDQGVIVMTGDILTITNSSYVGKMIINFKR